MKLFNPFQKTKKPKKLQATARAVPKQSADDYDEPNMKLSSAFIVVLLLHVVAVGGIYAFNSIKAHQTPPVDNVVPAKIQNADSKPALMPAANTTDAAKVHAQPEVKKQADLPEKHTPKDSGETYTVVKGDNPHAIARRLHVKYDDLLKLNKIDDPKKLQIGQKLLVPAKTKVN